MSRNAKMSLVLASLGATLAVSQSANGQALANGTTYTWTGKAGDGNWNTGSGSAANWSVNGVAQTDYELTTNAYYNYVFASSDYSAPNNTIKLVGSNAPAYNLTFNSSLTAPLTIAATSRLYFTIDSANHDVVNDSSPFAVTISATDRVQLQSGATLTSWNISSGSYMTVSAQIYDGTVGSNRGVSKTGGGTMVLTNNGSTFAGAFDVFNGTAQVSSIANQGIATKNDSGGITAVSNSSSIGNGYAVPTIQISSTSGTNGTLIYAGTTSTSTNRPILLNTAPNNAVQAATLTVSTAGKTLTLTGGVASNQTYIPDTDHAPMAFNIGGAGNVSVTTIGLGGTYSVNKVGAGTVEIDANSTWLGNTTVNQGTLLINGTHTPSAYVGAYEVQSGGTLGGTGTIGAPITVDAGGNLRPGQAGGTLTLSSLSLNGNFVLDVLADGTHATATANGPVTLGDGATISIVDAATLPMGTTFPVLTTSALSGTFAGLDGSKVHGTNNTYEVDYDANDIMLTVVPAPEPTALALFGLASAGLLQRRVRRIAL